MIDWDTRTRTERGRAAHGWAQSDTLRPVLVLIGALLLALVAGAVGALVVAGPQTFVSRGLAQTSGGAAVTVAPIEAPNAEATSVPTALPTLRPTAVPSPVPTPMPTPMPTPIPTAMPTPVPTPIPTAVPTAIPTADDLWPATLLALDAIWDTDIERSVAVLDDFVARFPDYEPAKEKEYAALVNYSQSLEADGDIDGASAQLMHARDLEPDRGEAPAMLQALQQTAAAPPPPAETQSDSGDTLTTVAEAAAPPPFAPASIPRAVVRQVQAAPPPPTPTKVPFLPPGG